MWLWALMTTTLRTGSGSQAAGLKWSRSSLHCTLSAAAHPKQQMFFCRKCSWSENSWARKPFNRRMFLIRKPTDDVWAAPATDLCSLCKAPTVWASTKVSGLRPLAVTLHKLTFADYIEVQKPLKSMSKPSNPNIIWFNKPQGWI